MWLSTEVTILVSFLYVIQSLKPCHVIWNVYARGKWILLQFRSTNILSYHIKYLLKTILFTENFAFHYYSYTPVSSITCLCVLKVSKSSKHYVNGQHFLKLLLFLTLLTSEIFCCTTFRKITFSYFQTFCLNCAISIFNILVLLLVRITIRLRVRTQKLRILSSLILFPREESV